MSTWTDVKAYVKSQLEPGVRNGTSVQKILDSILAVINQAASGSTEPVNSSLWNPNVIYPKDTQPVLYEDEWFVSNIADNQGIAPMDANGNVHGSWRLVSASSGTVQTYEAKVYTYSLEIVFHTGKIYYLDRDIVGIAPFSSVDFAAELSAGKWKLVAGEATTATYTTTLLFDSIFGKFLDKHIQTAAQNFTIAASGHKIGASIYIPFVADGVSAVNFDTNFDFFYGITSGEILAAGTYEFYFLYKANGKVTVNVPAGSTGASNTLTASETTVSSGSAGQMTVSWT